MSGTAPVLVDPTASLWVSAHAGAGKTRVLIDRVARLLIAGTPPERILCLTFTKAAAAEMAARLADTLGALALADDAALRRKLDELHVKDADEDVLARTRTLFARALETPGGLKIQTIHAFCERLLGRFPIEAGIAPDFEVLDDRGADELLGEAQAQELAKIVRGDTRAAEDAMARLAQNGDEAQFREIIRGLSAIRRDLAAAGRDPQDLRACLPGIRTALGVRAGETEASVTAAFLAALPIERLRAAASAMAQGTDRDRARANILGLAGTAPTPDALKDYVEVFLTKDGKPRKDICTKTIKDRHPQIAQVLRDEQARAATFVEYQRAVRAAVRAEAALDLGARVLSRYDALKRARGVLDYDDLILGSVALFARSSAAWVLYKLDGGLDHILVDEAQDTNPLQWRVIAALADEFFTGESARPHRRTIFAVGDEKQSIYRFQGADPAIFARMEAHFEAKLRAIGEDLRTPLMHKTRRSTAPVLALVDQVFAAPDLAKALSGSGPPKHGLARAGQAGLVELWPTEKPDPEQPPPPWNVPLDYEPPASPRARLARKIADVIRGWLDRGEVLKSLGRPITAGDVMVLVRRRDSFVEELIRALKQRGIPVAGSDRLALTTHIAVMDLMAVGAFALNPEDDLSLATVLKSPFFGFDDEALFALAHGRTGRLWAAVLSGRTPQAAAVRPRLLELLSMARAQPPFGFYARLLGALRGRALLVARLGADANDPIDEFLRLALDYERQHPPALQGFLHWLGQGKAEVKRDMEQGRDEVRVMTVHGAKGLEANIVILPDTCAMPHRTARSGFLPFEVPGIGMVPVWSARAAEAPEACAAVRAQLAEAAEAEHLRLLYVALTRARDRLYVCGHQTTKGRDPRSWHALVEVAMEKIAARCQIATGEEGYRREDPQTAPLAKRRDDAGGRAAPQALPSWFHEAAHSEPALHRTVSPSRLGEGETLEPAVLSPLRRDVSDRARFGRGRLIHGLLQRLPDLPAAQWTAAAQRYLAQPRHGLSLEAQMEIAAAVLGVLNHPDFTPLFAPGSRAEVPVAGTLELADGAVPVFGMIDRLALGADMVSLVDYKTNRPPPARAEDVPLAYLRQMAAYRAVLQEIYPGWAIRCVLLWTEGPSLMALPEPRLDEVFSGLRIARRSP